VGFDYNAQSILFLEDLGFCPKGEGGRFVSGGAIAPGGKIAVNTGAHQQKKIDIALVHGNGATLSSQSTAILGSADAL